jgi:DNA repair protein RadC
MQEPGGIKSWMEDERPREKMWQRGAAALTDAELLAILIASGTREKSALDLAREVLELAHRNLLELGRISLPELQKVKGIGQARAITICAALEIGRRRQLAEAPDRQQITSSNDAAVILAPLLRDLNHEAFYVVYLNQSNRVLRTEKISDGGMTMALADIRIILKNALLYNANQVILSHNHPSGNRQASEADKALTRRVQEAAKLMDIRLVDHIIIAGSSYLSMADEGIL